MNAGYSLLGLRGGRGHGVTKTGSGQPATKRRKLSGVLIELVSTSLLLSRPAGLAVFTLALSCAEYSVAAPSVTSVPLVPPSARSASLRTALAVIEAAAWPYAETLINHRPAAAKISAACIPDFPGLEGFTRAGRFPL